jgi:ribonuclease P protein component
MGHQYTLSKNERLKSLKAIRNLFEQGQKFKVSPILVYFHVEKSKEIDESSFPIKMGVSVGAKHFKHAVDRNLLKRRMREAYRQQKLPLGAFLKTHQLRMDVFFVYSHATLLAYSAIWQSMETVLEKLLTILEKNLQHD